MTKMNTRQPRLLLGMFVKDKNNKIYIYSRRNKRGYISAVELDSELEPIGTAILKRNEITIINTPDKLKFLE